MMKTSNDSYGKRGIAQLVGHITFDLKLCGLIPAIF